MRGQIAARTRQPDGARRRAWLSLGAMAALLPLAQVLANPLTASATAGDTTTFSPTAACAQTYTVPAYVTHVTIDAIGEAGGGGGGITLGNIGQIPIAGGAGGQGSEVRATVPVTPGSTLYINVATRGLPGGYGGLASSLGGTVFAPTKGGDGGYASWVSASVPAQGGANCDPTSGSLLVVAAGGGGGGGAGSGTVDETGGAGGTEGSFDGITFTAGPGAQPGGPNNDDNGGPGAAGGPSPAGHGGSAGHGITNVGAPTFVAQCNDGYAGFNGTAWQAGPQDGQGGAAAQDNSPSNGCGANAITGGYWGQNASGGGGGGGGGFYGGGGGGGADDKRAAGGGGGAGVSYVAPGAGSTIHSTTANPTVSITPVPVAPGFTGTNSLSCTVSLYCSLTVQTTGYPIPQQVGYAAGSGDLPPGMSLYSNGDGTATISGTVGNFPGSYPVTLEAANSSGQHADGLYTVTVAYGPLDSIVLSPSTAQTMTAGVSHLPMQAFGEYASGYQRVITSIATWTSSDPTVASVSSAGDVTPLNAGSTNVTAALGGKQGAIAVTVSLGSPTQLTVTPANPTVGLGGTQQYTATVTYQGGSTANVTNQVTWSVTDLGAPAATISGSGLATATGTTEGVPEQINAHLAVAGSDGIGGVAELTVTLAHPTSISIVAPYGTLAAGDGEQLAAIGSYPGGRTADITNQVTWSPSVDVLGAVNDSGHLSSFLVGGGGTIHVVAAEGGVSGSSDVTILAGLPDSITVSPVNPTVGLGQTQQLTATAHYTGSPSVDITSQVTWFSPDPTVISVSSGGLVTGTGTIEGQSEFIGATLSLPSGSAFGNTQVTLTLAHPVSIAISPLNVTLPPGSAQAFTATGTYPGGATADLTFFPGTWSSSNLTVGTFSGHQLDTNPSAGGGSTTVTATSGDGLVHPSTTVTLTAGNPSSISVTPLSPTLGLGTVTQFTATAHYPNGSTSDVTQQVTWSTTDATVASVTSAGAVTAVSHTQNANAFIAATYHFPVSGSTAASSSVTITLAHPTSITVTPTGVVLNVGEFYPFTATGTFPGGITADISSAVSWTSSDATSTILVHISGHTFDGGTTAGDAYAIATSGDGLVNGQVLVHAVGRVKVTGPVAGVTFSLDTIPVLTPYTSGTFTATGGSGAYHWTTSALPAGIALSSTTGSTVTLTGTPTTVLQTSVQVFATDPNSTALSQDEYDLTLRVVKLSQTISFDPIPATGIQGGSVTLHATGGGSSISVVFSVDTGFPAACGITGGTTLNFLYYGPCTVHANQAGNGNYNAATTVDQTMTVLFPRTLHWNATTSSAAAGTQFAAVAISSPAGGLTPVDSIDAASTNGACTLTSPTTINFVHVGTCVIDADSGAATFYAAAPEIQMTVTVHQGTQTVHFTSSKPGAAVVGQNYAASATGGASGQPVVITVDAATTNGACTVGGGSVDLVHVGSCVIDANQAGSADYSAASGDSQTFAVGQANQVIAFTSSPPTDAQVGDPPYVITATSGGSGLPLVVTVDALTSPTGACTVNHQTVLFIAGGTCVVDANQAGNGDYTAAVQQSQQFAMKQFHLAITSDPFTMHTIDGRSSFDLSIEDASGNPTTSHSDTTVNLYSSSPTADFAAAAAGATVTALTIPTGDSGLTGYFGDTSAGTPTIIAADHTGAFGSDRQVETVLKYGSTTAITSDLTTTTGTGQSYTVSGTVSPAVSAPGSPTGQVVVDDGSGASCNATVASGGFSCALTSTTAGTKTVTATYQGDAAFASSSDTASHTVIKYGSVTAITSDESAVTPVGQPHTVAGTVGPVAPASGTPTGLVVVDDGSGASCNATLASGAFSCALTSTTVGTKTITATYQGDSAFSGSSTSASHTVKQAASLTYTGTTGTTPGSRITLSATLKNGATALTGRAVVFTLNGVTFNATTNNKGVASVATTAPAAAGSYPVNVTFSGDATYAPATAAAVLADPFLTAVTYTGPTSVGAGTPVSLSATLKTSTGTPLAGKTVTFALNSLSYTGTTDASGVATAAAVAPAATGTYAVGVSFAGDTTGQASSGSGSLQVVSTATVLTYTGPTSALRSTSVAFTAALTTGGGAPVAGRSVTFTFAGHSRSGKTNAAGLVSVALTAPKAPGVYPVVVEFGGDTTYAASKVTVQFTVT